MTETIAFLRAINVGGRNVKMDDLKPIFTSLGLTAVQTYIQSGNVGFETDPKKLPTLIAMIEAELASKLGFEVPVFLRTRAEVEQLAATNPFSQTPDKEHVLYISFLGREPTAEEAAPLLAKNSAIDEFEFIGADLFWLNHKSAGDSGLTQTKIDKILGIQGTRRNMNTVQKIVKKFYG